MGTESGSFSCPQCSRETPTATGLKTHWTRIHGGEYPDALLEQIPDSGPEYIEKEFECERCGDSFIRQVPSGESRRFCSRSCASKHQHETRENPIDPTAPKSDARRKALERDNYTCQRCGCKVEDGLRETSQSAEVHHLIPKMAGGTDALANLITLCFRCHQKAHRDMKKIPEHHPDLLEELRDVVCKED